jgi:hypothetical protein
VRNFFIWTSVLANIGFIFWRLVIILSSLRRLARGENGISKGITMTSVALGLEELILAISLVRLGFNRDPFPMWILGVRTVVTWLITTPVVTYLMREMGFIAMVVDWLEGDDD